MKKILSPVLCLALMMFFVLGSYTAKGDADTIGLHKSGAKSTDPTDYAPNTRERYIASICKQKGITFEEAKKINDKEVASLLKNRPADEEIRYKTVDKHAEDINSGKKAFKVNMATEVRYLWSNAYNKPVQIENIAPVIIYIPSANISAIVGGEFNIEQTLTKARVSQTATITFSANASDKITVGGDILDVSPSSAGAVHLTTKAKTYILNIGFADLY